MPLSKTGPKQGLTISVGGFKLGNINLNGKLVLSHVEVVYEMQNVSQVKHKYARNSAKAWTSYKQYVSEHAII